MEQDLAALDRLGVEVELCVFEGGHVWSPEFYRAAEGFLARIAADGS
jgi:predicted esterase